jgi:hypothetical protein
LIIVVQALKEGLSVKDHASKHAANTPDVQLIIVVAIAYKQFRGLEVPGGDPYIKVFMW